MLHHVVRAEWPALRALCKESNDGRGLPVFIEKAVEKYLKCGDLRHGFVRAVCNSCHEGMVVAFSCKARGICNSCDGRRMTEVAAHWVDEVIPAVPVRQFVLTFPWDLRYLLAWNAPLRTAVLNAFQRALEAHYRRQALADGGEDPKYAAVSVVQRFDGAARLCVHVHVLVADGAFCATPGGRTFLPAPPLYQEQVEALLADAIRRIGRQARRLAAKPADPVADDDHDDTLTRRDPALAALLRNAMLGRQSVEGDAATRRPEANGASSIKPHGRNCATSTDGFSLHANTRVGAQARAGLEKLAQYLCRPALAASRMERVDAHNVRIRLKNEWRGGVTSVVVASRDLLIRALAQIPLSGRPSIRYYGCFAPNSSARKHVVPAGARPKCRRAKPGDDETECAVSTRMLWADAQRRAFLWEVLDCHCGGRREVIAAVQDKAQIERFLRHLGLWQEGNDIVSIRGPPEDLDFPDDEPRAESDAIDDLEPLPWAA